MVLKLPSAQKKNVVSVWKEHVSIFDKFFIDKVEMIFGES